MVNFVTSSPTSSNKLNQWANELDLTSIRVEEDIMSNAYRVELRRGKRVATFMVSETQLNDSRLGRIEVLKDIITAYSAKLPVTRFDMRYNAIEGMNDFLTLINREREQAHDIDTVVLTPEQTILLQQEAFKDQTPQLIGQPILTIYGYTIETKGQD